MPRTQIGNMLKQNQAEQLRNSLPEENAVAVLINRYMRAQQMTRADVGKKLGVSSQTVSIKLLQPLSMWTFADVKKYCAAVECPLSDALAAAEKQYC